MSNNSVDCLTMSRRQGHGPVFRKCSTKSNFQDVPQPVRVKPSSDQLMKTLATTGIDRKVTKPLPEIHSTKRVVVSNTHWELLDRSGYNLILL